MTIGIRSIKSFVPEGSLSNEELMARFDVDAAFLNDKLGVHVRHIASPDEAASDLAVKAAEKLIASGLDKNSVDLLIICTQNPDYKIPNTASIVQNKLNLPNSIASFDLNQGCSGFIYSLAVAKSMMAGLNYRNSLVVTVDPYSKIIDKADKNTAMLFGDGAAAIWLSTESSNQVLGFSFGTDGSGFDKLFVGYGGSKNPVRILSENDIKNRSIPDIYLRMDGRAIFNFMMSRVPANVHDCLGKNGLTVDEIDFFIFHQASKYMLDNLRKCLKIPQEKMVYHIASVGNTVSSSIPLALEDLMSKGNLKNKQVLLCGFGTGLSWGSTVIKF